MKVVLRTVLEGGDPARGRPRAGARQAKAIHVRAGRGGTCLGRASAGGPAPPQAIRLCRLRLPAHVAPDRIRPSGCIGRANSRSETKEKSQIARLTGHEVTAAAFGRSVSVDREEDEARDAGFRGAARGVVWRGRQPGRSRRSRPTWPSAPRSPAPSVRCLAASRLLQRGRACSRCRRCSLGYGIFVLALRSRISFSFLRIGNLCAARPDHLRRVLQRRQRRGPTRSSTCGSASTSSTTRCPAPRLPSTSAGASSSTR